jgi:hypothetical protein
VKEYSDFRENNPILGFLCEDHTDFHEPQQSENNLRLG